jgi:hypothetical protein
MTAPTNYSGELRPRITIIAIDHARVEWLNVDNVVIWTEDVKPPIGMSFMSQIVCDGNFSTRPGYFVDPLGKRHFVMACDPGRLGSMFNN